MIKTSKVVDKSALSGVIGLSKAKDGFVKIFCRPGTGVVVGGVVVAPRASELIYPITIAVQSGVLRIPADRFNAARTLGASPLQVLRHVTLPSILPDLLTGTRVAVGFAWTTIVAADQADAVLKAIREAKHRAWTIGEVVKGTGLCRVQ